LIDAATVTGGRRPVADGDGAAVALARFAAGWFRRGLPAAVQHEGRRALLNAASAGIAGGAGEGARELEQALLQAHGPGRSGGLGGRGTTRGLSPESAAHLVAFCVTQNDFDDAHLATIVHPGAAALGGLMAAATDAAALEQDGAHWLAAFALACEVQLVVACTVAPSHYEYGWHSTATGAALGAATAYGLLVGLDEDRLAHVYDRVALRTSGLREAHGTLMKGFQVGAAAADGVRTAAEVARSEVLPALQDGPILLTRPGATLAIGAVEQPRPRLARRGDDAEAPDRPEAPGVVEASDVDDVSWELERLTYKPYPAGIVSSAGIDAALALHGTCDVAAIREVEVVVAPLVVDLAGDPAPVSEMRARVSLPHAVAVGLLVGRAGLEEFSAACIERPDVSALRARVRMVADASLPRATTIVEVHLADGTSRTVRVDQPRGSAERPLTDDELAAKSQQLLAAAGPGRALLVRAAVEQLTVAPSGDAFLAAVGGR